MVAHATNSIPMRGARAFDAPRDLYPAARLLEEAFRPDNVFPLSTSPLFRELGIILWTLSYTPTFPPGMTGLVWGEDGRMVGDLTLNQDEGRADRFMISNVAVKPEYRRQGIARQLVMVALDELRERGAHTIILNARPSAPGAIKLYANLGFQEIEMRGEWSLTTAPTDLIEAHATIRPVRRTDDRAIAELLRAVTPASVEQIRPRLHSEFTLPLEDRFFEWLIDLATGQRTRRWAVERNDRLAALILTRGQKYGAPHRIHFETHPRFRGQIETELIAFALRELSRFPARELRVSATDTYPEMIAALEQHGFKFLNGLMLMAMTM
ncbi:MAG: GNAT family N-acetyltransferase [Chloroflexi bacterium]|nr:GNAT family N-acetyltransferase [Chloroflexota bacterium]